MFATSDTTLSAIAVTNPGGGGGAAAAADDEAALPPPALAPTDTVLVYEVPKSGREPPDGEELDRLERLEWDVAFSQIRTQNTLAMLHFRGHGQTPLALTDGILRAVQYNAGIHTVGLIGVVFSAAALSNLLNEAPFLTELRLRETRIHSNQDDTEGGISQLCSSIRRNASIRTYCLWSVEDFFWTQILRSLIFNTHVRKVHVRPTTLSAAAALQQLLESTTSMVELEIGGEAYGFDEAICRPIVDGLVNSASVIDIKLRQCVFRDQSSNLLLTRLFRSKSNIRALSVGCCSLSVGGLSAMVFANLFRPGSPLKEFTLDHITSIQLTNAGFKGLLSLVAKSNLEVLRIGINTYKKIDSLLEYFPSIRILRYAFFDFSSILQLATLKPSLLRAAKGNGSLLNLSARCQPMDVDIFNPKERRLLNHFAARNKGLARLLAAPESLPPGAWPVVLANVAIIGAGTVFGILQLLGDFAGHDAEDQRSFKRQCRR